MEILFKGLFGILLAFGVLGMAISSISVIEYPETIPYILAILMNTGIIMFWFIVGLLIIQKVKE